MLKFSAPANHSERLAVAALVMISVGSLLVVNEIGGIVLAALFHAITSIAAIAYISSEPARLQRKVRARTHVLQDLAYRDGLTGLPNRRFFNWYLEQYLPRQAEQGPVNGMKTSLVLFDLNGFKAVNDTHGHDAGDELLKYISESLSTSLPSDVLLARLGGDEFVALVRDRAHGRTLNAVERIIRKCAKSVLVYDRKRIQVSASIGVSTTRSDYPDVGGMLREADARMYDDKAASKKAKSSSILHTPMTVELEV